MKSNRSLPHLSVLVLLHALDSFNVSIVSAQTSPTLSGQRPIIIGHRGASGYLPEHTLEAYSLAIDLGADFIEPDLVATKDGVLIARHEPMLGATTDVGSRPEFAGHKTTKIVDGVSVTDWFTSDFTLEEIKTLRAVQSRANRPQQFNGLYQVPTLAEVIELAQKRSSQIGREIGIYPETKHPTFHDKQKSMTGGTLSLEEPLLAALDRAGWNSSSAPVFIQSFEVANLQELNKMTEVKLVQLIDADDVAADGSLVLKPPYAQPYDFVLNGDSRTFQDLLSSTGLDFVRTYADGIGPWKTYLIKTVDDGIDRNGDGQLTINDRAIVGETGIVSAAHDRGLSVHTWTFRDDASQYGFSDAFSEYRSYLDIGVDGVFSDFPDSARAAIPEPNVGTLVATAFATFYLVHVRQGRRRGVPNTA